MIWRRRRSKAELAAGIRGRRRLRARRRRLSSTWAATRTAVDPAEAGPSRPRPVERTGPVAPPRYGARGRRYQVVDLGGGVFGVRVDRRVVSHHRSAAEANRCIELMEENR